MGRGCNRRRETAGDGRRRAGILEAIQIVARKAWALGGTEEGLHGAVVWCEVCLVGVGLGVGRAHLVPDGIVFVLLGVVLVEIDHVDGGLGILLLLLLGDAVLLQHALPFLGETLRHGQSVSQSVRRGAAWRAGTHGELARLVVDADVGDVHGVGGRRDGRAARRAQHAAHKGREGALLLAAVGAALLGRVAIVAVAIARALGARWRGIHFAGEGVERGRLAQARRAEARGLVGRLRVLGGRRSTLAGAGRGRQSFLDDGVERGPDRGRGEVGDRGRRGFSGQVNCSRIRRAVLVVGGRQ